MKRIVNILIILVMTMDMEGAVHTVSGQINGHDYVDLGLPSGLKWATSNLQDTRPYPMDGIFAWGETEMKSFFDCFCYKWCMRNSEEEPTPFPVGADNTDLFQLTKYGKIDGKTKLEAADDAAMALWGLPWRMPTAEELQELYDNCRWEEVPGGIMGTSKLNGATILLPFLNGSENCPYVDSITDITMTFDYAELVRFVSLWSSTASKEWEASSLEISCLYDGEGAHVGGGVASEPRFLGINIRAVSR